MLLALVVAACSEDAPPEASDEDLRPGALSFEDPSADEYVREEAVEPGPPTEVIGDVRQVIPGREVRAPQPGEEVERLPAPPVPITPARPASLGIVVVQDATLLDTRRGKVRLAQTASVAPDEVCPLADGRTPLCATLARTAVRRYVGQRSVSCILGEREDTSEDHIAPCFLGEADLALWVVAQGWAYADGTAGQALRDAQSRARQEQNGLWAILGN